jgi:hypothetical protein
MMRFLAPAFAAAPLILACLVLPLARALPAWMGPEGARLSEAAAQGLWFGLAWLGVLGVLFQKRKGPASFLSQALFLAVATAALFLYAAPALRELRPSPAWIAELTPPAFLLLAGLWAASFGPPSRKAFLRCGGILGLLCAADFLLALILGDGPLPPARLGRSGPVSCLLLFCLCAGLRAQDEPEPPPADAWTALILLGLTACLARMALFTAGWALLFFGPGSRLRRSGSFLLCLLLVAGSLALPLDASALLGLADQPRQWMAVLNTLGSEPWGLVTGLPLDAVLPPDAAPDPSPLLLVMGHRAAVSLADIQVYWLRLTASFGLAAAPLVLCGLALPVLRRPTAFGAGVFAACLTLGLVTDLFYAPGPAVLAVLALWRAWLIPQRADA